MVEAHCVYGRSTSSVQECRHKKILRSLTWTHQFSILQTATSPPAFSFYLAQVRVSAKPQNLFPCILQKREPEVRSWTSKALRTFA